MSTTRLGDFNRGYSICEFILEGHTLKEAAKEFRISTSTATKDINRVGMTGLDCKTRQPERSKKLLSMYVKVKKHLCPDYFERERTCITSLY